MLFVVFPRGEGRIRLYSTTCSMSLQRRYCNAKCGSSIAVGLALGTALLLLLFLAFALFPFPLLFLLLLLLAILFWCDIFHHPFPALRVHLVLHLVFPLFLYLPLFCVLAQEVLSALDLQIHLALLLGRRERRVCLLCLVGNLVGYAALAERALFEVGEEAIPALVD
jgi:hypothetical protein